MALLAAPSSVPLPVEIAAFFATAVRRVIERPSADTIRNIHSILSGIGGYILESLSPDSLGRLQGQLIQIVFRLDRDNHETNAFCLAVLAQMAIAEPLAEPGSSDSSIVSAEPSKDRPNPFEPARKLFADKNTPKVLDFIFGRARWACSPSVSETVDRRLEVLELCKITVKPTTAEARQHWLSSRSSMSKKIIEHINRHDLNAEVRCSVCINVPTSILWF